MATFKKTKGKSLEDIEAGFKSLKKILPVLLANNAEDHFKEGFRKGGKQTNSSKSGWKKLSDRYNKRKNKDGKKRAILVSSGDLRRDIQRRKTSFSRSVVATNNIPYAARHNEGLKGVPKREFIGKSDVLKTESKAVIKKEIDKIVK